MRNMIINEVVNIAFTKKFAAKVYKYSRPGSRGRVRQCAIQKAAYKPTD